MAAFAVHTMFVLCLLVAFPYWNLSLLVTPHTPLECSTQCHHKQTNETSILLNVLFVVCNKQHSIYNMHNNVYLCSYDKSEHYLSHKDKDLCSYLSKHSFSTSNYHQGPPIKWWENIGYETKRKNVKLKPTYELVKFSSKPQSKNCIYALYRFNYMAEASSTKNMDVCIVAENEITNNPQKITTSALLTITQKKAKSKKNLGAKGLSLWLGFQALNHIYKQKDLPLECIDSTLEMMKIDIDFDEAKEMQKAKPSFPYVPQKEWPSKRDDGIEGQHFNLTQLPFDMEVDENGFSFDYQIAVNFELKETKWDNDVIMTKVKERLDIMKIKTGDLIGEPIAIMCYHKSNTWSETIKFHLDNPVVDAKSLLQGTKAFILNLDEGEPWRGKVCKSYDMLALNNLLSVKITSDTIIGKE